WFINEVNGVDCESGVVTPVERTNTTLTTHQDYRCGCIGQRVGAEGAIGTVNQDLTPIFSLLCGQSVTIDQFSKTLDRDERPFLSRGKGGHQCAISSIITRIRLVTCFKSASIS